MRTENIWETIKEIARRTRGAYKVDAEKAIIGTTVLTIYNNKKYRSKRLLFIKFITRNRELAMYKALVFFSPIKAHIERKSLMTVTKSFIHCIFSNSW